MAFEGKLVKDRYYHDLSDTGLYFDLAIIKRNVPGEDENGLRARLAALDKLLPQETNAHGQLISARKPTLFVTKGQYDAFSADHIKLLYAVCYLMVADKAQTDWTYPLWDANGGDGLLWISHDKVLSKWDGNAMHYRYRVASQNEVDSYVSGTAVVLPTTPPITGDEPGSGAVTAVDGVPTKWNISLSITGTIEAVEE